MPGDGGAAPACPEQVLLLVKSKTKMKYFRILGSDCTAK